MNISRMMCVASVSLCPLLASAQLAVMVSSPQITGSKAVVRLAMKNNFTQKVESARALVFLLDDHGKVLGQSAKWVIGGSTNNPGLAAGGSNTFYFVIQSAKPFTTTNLTSKVTFTRVVLEGDKMVDVKQSVDIHE